jgi:hypothetical protein
MMETNAVYYAQLVVLMALTELDFYLDVGQKEPLKALWAALIGFRPQTRAYYEARFKVQLEAP